MIAPERDSLCVSDGKTMKCRESWLSYDRWSLRSEERQISDYGLGWRPTLHQQSSASSNPFHNKRCVTLWPCHLHLKVS
jgi:hypothetical protein